VKTTFSAIGGAPTDSAALDIAGAEADIALQKYGFTPTLTLRLGFDLI